MVILAGLAHAEEPAVVGPALPDPLGVEAARAERAHLVRLGVFAGASAVGGGVVAAAGWEDPRLQSAGLMTVGWAGVNALIVGLAWRGTATPPTAAQRARTREIFQLNLGLDFGYVGAGLAMGVLGHLDDRRAVEGAGWAIAAQGVGLAALDAVALAQIPR